GDEPDARDARGVGIEIDLAQQGVELHERQLVAGDAAEVELVLGGEDAGADVLGPGTPPEVDDDAPQGVAGGVGVQPDVDGREVAVGAGGLRLGVADQVDGAAQEGDAGGVVVGVVLDVQDADPRRGRGAETGVEDTARGQPQDEEVQGAGAPGLPSDEDPPLV